MRAQMRAFSERVRGGLWRGFSGEAHPRRGEHRHRRLRPRPAMVVPAPCRPTPRAGLRMHFVSNLDGAAPGAPAATTWTRARTLFIVAEQDLHHPGNHDSTPHRAPVAVRRGRRARRPGRAAAFVAVTARPRTRCASSACRPSNIFSILGLGRRALLAVVRHRPAHGAGHRHDRLRAPAGRRPGHGPAFLRGAPASGTCRC